MIQPLHNQILVRPIEEKKKGLILEDEGDKVLITGKILKTGENVKKLTQKDKVLFFDYSADKAEIEGEELYFVTEDKVIGVLL